MRLCLQPGIMKKEKALLQNVHPVSLELELLIVSGNWELRESFFKDELKNCPVMHCH